MIGTIYYAYFQSQIKYSYGKIFWQKQRDNVIFFCTQKKVIKLIYDVNTCDSCRHIFVDYRILTEASRYILEVLSFIKKIQREFKT